MDTKKTLISSSLALIATVDYLKWLDSCDASYAQQMEYPFSGVALAAPLSDLFALARDEAGWMLTMRAEEGGWLAHLPLHSAYMGFSDGLVLLTDTFTLLEETVPQMALQISVPEVALVELLNAQTLLGFGLATPGAGAPAYAVTRVNRMVPLYTKARYDAERREAPTAAAGTRRMFAR